MKKIIVVLVLLAALFMALPTSANAELLDSTSYYVNESTGIFGKTNQIPIPKSFTNERVILQLDIKGQDVPSQLKNPTDMFVHDGYMYVADTGNNRIVKLSMSGEILLNINSFDHEESSFKNLKAPEGVYVDADGDIFISDTGNKRIVHVDRFGNFVEQFVKPESEALKNTEFEPTRLYINNSGLIYMLLKKDFQGFMVINGNNEYIGSTGSTWVTASFLDWLWRKIGTEQQLMSRSSLVAPPYRDFIIDKNGMIYAVVVTVEENQIVKLNSMGENIYPEGNYGEYWSSGQVSRNNLLFKYPYFVDIDVDNYGIIYALDQNTRTIYMYDSEGNNLATFGGYGSGRVDKFMTPVGLCVGEDGLLYVLDQAQSAIQIFRPTYFTEQLRLGVNLYESGRYAEARDHWQEVLEIDATYMFAHRAMGKALVKEQKYVEALAEYKLAEDTEGYSQTFKKYKNMIVQEYFVWIALAVVAFIALVLFAFIKIKRYSDKLHYKITTWNGGAD